MRNFLRGKFEFFKLFPSSRLCLAKLLMIGIKPRFGGGDDGHFGLLMRKMVIVVMIIWAHPLSFSGGPKDWVESPFYEVSLEVENFQQRR